MTWYGVLVILYISGCFTTNSKAQQEIVISSSGPGNCAGMENGYIAFYRCMLQCFQDLGYDGAVESDFCSGGVQVAIFQSDGSDAFTIDDLNDALQCVTGRCRSVIPPSVCPDSSPQLVNLPEELQEELLPELESGQNTNGFDSQSENNRHSSQSQSERSRRLEAYRRRLEAYRRSHRFSRHSRRRKLHEGGASDLLSEVLKATGIQPGQLPGLTGLLPGDDTGLLPGDDIGLIPGDDTGLVPGDDTGLLPGDGTGLQPGELPVPGIPGTPGQVGGFGLQFPGLDASELLSRLQPGQSVVAGLQPGQLPVPGIPGIPGQVGGFGFQFPGLDASGLLSRLQPGQSVNVAGVQPGQSVVSGLQPGQSDTSDLLTKMLQGFIGQTGQLDSLVLQPGQGVDVSGIQPGQSNTASGPQSKSLAFASAPGDNIEDCDDYDKNLQTGQFDDLVLQPGQGTDVSGIQPGQSNAVAGTQSESLAFASAPGDNIEDCDDYDESSQDSVSSNNPTTGSTVTSESTISGASPASFPTGTTSELSTSGVSDSSAGSSISSESVSTLSTDSMSDLSEDDCDEYDSNTSDNENSNSFSAKRNNFQSAVAVASSGDNTEYSSSDSYYYNYDCFYYDDFNGTFSNCSFYDESFSNSSDYDNATDYSNYDESSAFSEVQTNNQNTGIQQYQSNSEGASSISVVNGQNQGDFANAEAFNQNSNTGQNIGIVPSDSSQNQDLFASIPAQNQGPTIQQSQNNNNGFQDLYSQILGQFGNTPFAGQSINQGQIQNPFSSIPGFQIPGSQIPAVQQYQITNNGGGFAIGSGQNPSQFVNTFLQNQGFGQNSAGGQNNGFSTDQQYPAPIIAAGNGGPGQTQGILPNVPAQTQTVVANNFGSLPLFNSAQNGANIQQFNVGDNNPLSAVANVGGDLSQTQGGFASNVPAGNNFGIGPNLNFQQNSGNLPLYNGGVNNPVVSSAVAGSESASQFQSSQMNAPVQGIDFSGNGFGSGPSFNTFQYSGNSPQINGGGIGANANGGAVNSYASSGASSGFNNPGLSTNNQPNGGNVPFSQGSASAFGSSANAQAQASAG